MARHHFTALARARPFLAAESPKLKEKLPEVLSRHTDRKLITADALEADISETLKRGFGYDTGEFRDRILSFGATINLPGGEPVGAIGISLPDLNLPEDGVEKFGALLVHAARGVSAKLANV